jgi:2-keto-3-deoxy-L-rhamnonate aldolase RhmA
MEFLRKRVLGGELVAGAWLNLASPVTAEMAGLAGYDWILFDQEHGPGDYWTLLHQLQAASRFPAAPFVRVPWTDRIIFKKVLDLGMAGIMSPNIQTREQAADMVRFARYTPAGERGVAGSPRCASYTLNFQEYYEHAIDNITLLAQIESGEAVKNAEAIAAVDGIDVLFVGPLDLSVSTGLRGMYKDEKFMGLLGQVAQAAKNAGKASGILLPNAELVPALKALGFTVIACNTDGGMVVNGLKTDLAALRKE